MARLAAMIVILFTLTLFACGRHRPAPVTIEEFATPQPRPAPRNQVTPLPDERLWTIPGGFWTTHELSGTLSPDDGGRQTLLVQVDGLAPGSPSATSRSVAITLTCEDEAPLGWRYEPSEPDSPTMDCGETTSVYFSYDYNVRHIHVRALQPLKRTTEYTLVATVHAPY